MVKEIVSDHARRPCESLLRQASPRRASDNDDISIQFPPASPQRREFNPEHGDASPVKESLMGSRWEMIPNTKDTCTGLPSLPRRRTGKRSNRLPDFIKRLPYENSSVYSNSTSSSSSLLSDLIGSACSSDSDSITIGTISTVSDQSTSTLTLESQKPLSSSLAPPPRDRATKQVRKVRRNSSPPNNGRRPAVPPPPPSTPGTPTMSNRNRIGSLRQQRTLEVNPVGFRESTRSLNIVF